MIIYTINIILMDTNLLCCTIGPFCHLMQTTEKIINYQKHFKQ